MQNYPTSVDSIKDLDTDAQDTMVRQLKSIFDEHQKAVVALVGKVVHQQLILNPADVSEINIRPNYEYNDEGYAFSNVMVQFEDYDEYYEDEKENLQAKIDDALAELAPMLKNDVSFQVSDLVRDFGPLTAKKKEPKKFGKIRKYNI